MWTQWIKPFLPRSLLWRAILILVIPIIFVQIVVGFVFVERLFGDVSRQLTANTAVRLNYVLDTIRDDGGVAERAALADRAAQLAVDATFLTPAEAEAEVDRKAFSDLSGTYVTEILYDRVPDLAAVDLVSLDGKVRIVVNSPAGSFFWKQLPVDPSLKSSLKIKEAETAWAENRTRARTEP